MRNALRLFADDVRHLGSNVVTLIIVVGLVALPCLFSWYNIIACWDVFDNTGNLRVAVANDDAGYKSELVPVRITIGEQVVSALRANDSFDWVFTDSADAIDGTRAGRYYAAVVIPEEFSRDMLSFFSEDVEHAQITYYTNQKKNAIAPKLTDQGADAVSVQVNEVFAQTLTEVALGLAGSLADYADSADVDSTIGRLAARVSAIGDQMTAAAGVVGVYEQMLGAADGLVTGTGALLAGASESAADAADALGGAQDAAGQLGAALDGAQDAFAQAIGQSQEAFVGTGDDVDAALAGADTLAGDAAEQLRQAAGDVGEQAARYAELADELRAMRDAFAQIELPDADVPGADLPTGDAAAAFERLIGRADEAASALSELQASLAAAADALDGSRADAQAKRDDAARLLAEARDAVGDVQAAFDDNVAPALERLSSSVQRAADVGRRAGAVLGELSTDLSGGAGSVSAQVSQTRSKLAAAQAELAASGAELTEMGRSLSQALATGDSELLRAVLSADPTALAAVIASPVTLDRHAIYPVENFGSAMAPLYTSLALWIGALLCLVAFRVNPSPRALARLDDPTPQQLFCGRFGVVALVSLAQSTAMCLGNLFFLGVQCANPLLYLLCFWTSGLLFAFIVYTLVASFANLGKALSVVLLIVQVSGGGGSYPLALLPQFFQAVSPYLPITHAINAMRAAMFGVYAGDFWAELALLALFAVPFVLLGLVLRVPLMRVVARFIEKVESSELM